MGFARQNGYSASVQGFLVVGARRHRLAKTNGVRLVLVEPTCDLPPGTEAEMLIIVDGDCDSKRITLPEGIAIGQDCARYERFVPF